MPTALGPGRGRSVAGRGNGHRKSDQGGPGPAAGERDRVRPGTGRGKHANLKESRRRSGVRTASGPNRTTSSRAGPDQRGDRVKEAVRTQPRATTRSRQRNRRGTAGPGGRDQITVIRSTQIEKTELRYVCASAKELVLCRFVLKCIQQFVVTLVTRSQCFQSSKTYRYRRGLGMLCLLASSRVFKFRRSEKLLQGLRLGRAAIAL